MPRSTLFLSIALLALSGCGPTSQAVPSCGRGVCGTTALQAALNYTAANSNQCTVEVSTSPTYSPVVLAVDATKFINANMDGQTNIGARTFVVGRRWIAQENVSPPSASVTACTVGAVPKRTTSSKPVACTITNSPFAPGDNVVVTAQTNAAFNDAWSRVVIGDLGGTSLTYVVPYTSTATGTSASGTLTRADRYSLALRNNTTYYYRIGGASNTCGAKPATGTFATTNVPNGKTWTEVPLVDATTLQQLEPTIFEDRTSHYIDPLTGIDVQRLSLYADKGTATAAPASKFRTCSIIPAAGGYLCMHGSGVSGSGNLYWLGNGTVHFLGAMNYTYHDAAAGSNATGHIMANASPFDAADPNRFYLIAPTGGGYGAYKWVLGYVEYNGGYSTDAAPGANWSTVPSGGGNVTLLTPYATGNTTNTLSDQMNACVTANTPAGACFQDPTYSAAKFAGCGELTVQGDNLLWQCTMASQDSASWYFVWSISKGQIIAGANTFSSNAIARWGGGHGTSSNGSINWYTDGEKTLGGITAGAQAEVVLVNGVDTSSPATCPGTGCFTVTGYQTWAPTTTYDVRWTLRDPNGNYQQESGSGDCTSGTAQPTWATTLASTTTDNTCTWVNRGAAAASGEPQNVFARADTDGNYWSYLTDAKGATAGGTGGLAGGAYNGDLFQFQDTGAEIVRLVTKDTCTDGNCTWSTVSRALYNTTAHTHAAGARLVAISELETQGYSGVFWDFIHDPTRADTTGTYLFYEPWHPGHGWSHVPYLAQSGAMWVKTPPDWTSTDYESTFIKGYPAWASTEEWSFAGISSSSAENYSQDYRNWSSETAAFKDSVYVLKTMVGGTIWGTFTNVTGSIYKMTRPWPTGISASYLVPYMSMQSWQVLRDISAPSSLLPNTGSGDFCYAVQAGECWSGSTAGDIYADLPSMAAGVTTCLGGGDGGVMASKSADWCFFNMSMDSPGIAQEGLIPGKVLNVKYGVPITDGSNSRQLLGSMFGPAMLTTSYVHGVPDGSMVMFTNCVADPHINGNASTGDAYGCQVYGAEVPPQPPQDGIDRTDFENVDFRIGTASGATQARLKWGYLENERHAVTDSIAWPPTMHYWCTQYQATCYWNGSATTPSFAAATFAGLPLNSFQSLQIGAPQRMLFYQVDYLNAAGTLIASDPMKIAAVP